METLIPKLYKLYGNYTNLKKMFPHICDGLIPIQRRILLSAHYKAKTKFTKTIIVLAEAVKRWHPHDLPVGTAQWGVNNLFLDGSGLWGNPIRGIKAAAPRYTNLKMNDFIEELALKYVNYVEWKSEELEPEPIALPTMLPFCLFPIYALSAIGFGFKAEIPCYKKENLAKRLLFLLKSHEQITIKPNIVGCKILSGNKECEELLTTGKGKIEIQGTYKIDEKNRKIYIRGWSPKMSFDTLFNKINKYNKWNLLDNGDIGYVDEADSKFSINYCFVVNKMRNTKEIFDKMKKAIISSLKSTLSFDTIVTDGTNVLQPSVDKMLLTTYKYYKEAFQNYLNDSIEKTKDKIKELDIIDKIRPHMSDIVKKDIDIDKVCQKLETLTKILKSCIKEVIEKYRIKRLLTVSTDINDLKKEIKEKQKGLKNIETICINKYKELCE